MALFDKPFRYVPNTDPADMPPRGDVAVVDPAESAAAVTGKDMLAVPAETGVVGGKPADQTVEPVVEEPAVSAFANEAGEAVAIEAASPAAVPNGNVAVEVVPIDVPVPVVPERSVSADAVSSDVPAPVVVPDRSAPVVELVRRDEHELRPAGDPSGLVVFSRTVPSVPAGSAPRDTQRLVTAIAESEPVLDQLRSLAASLHQARAGRELRVIAVTSSVSGEGKTLLAANLALTLSRSYMRQVLLIDADLRRPGLHRLFGTSSQDGIHSAMDAVREGAPVAVQEVAPRLALLPAGKPVRDPISVLASDAMQRLMASANAAFDWVIIDTPPVGMLPDMSLLGSLSDAVLLVVESGRVRYDLVQRTVETIGADRIFGVVLNKVPEQDIVASYGMHYYAPYR